MTKTTTPELRLIDRWAVIRMLGISESTLERMQLRDEAFPPPRRIGNGYFRYLR